MTVRKCRSGGFPIAKILLPGILGMTLLPYSFGQQPFPPQTTVPGPVQPLSERSALPTALRDLVAEAERTNPEIAASYHSWQAATNVAKQARALPETEVRVQQFAVGSPRPFAGFNNSEFAYIGLGASQEIPFPGKRGLRGKIAAFEAESRREGSDAVRRRVIEQLKLVYYRLAYIEQTLGILEKSDQLLSQVQQVAESRYRVGQGNQQDVLKSQLQHTKILQEVAHHHQEEGQLQAQLKQLLNRPQTSSDIVAETLTPTFLLYNASQLLQFAQEKNPDVRSKQRMVRREEARAELAHKNFRPDFMAEYMWQHTNSQTRDYYMATVGIRLPNRGREKAEVAEAEQNRELAKQDLQAEVQRALSEIKQQYVMVRSSEERLNIYKGGLIPQADATFRSAMAAYQANRQDFETLLSTFLDVLNLDLQYRNELAEHESALARLERLTGVPLP
jgi:cobalt-zinc-cadmium efflux system outer membrane protein